MSSCDIVNTVLGCYNSNRQVCDQQSIGFELSRAFSDHIRLECARAPTVDISTTEGPTLNNDLNPCPSLPVDFHGINFSLNMSRADVSPRPHPSECTLPLSQTSRLRQCSLFMDSQLRAFTSYRGGLETCSLPGTWYLLRHPSLSIEVEGSNLELGSNHTRLTKVNVTFHSHGCNPNQRTYTAYNSEALPSDFSPPLLGSESPNSTLQLMSGKDGSVVTLMATWLNATIVIRQYTDFLSITQGTCR